MDRPVISFLTDFGADLAPAICRGVMLSIAPDAQIIDISHGVRKFAILEGAYLLWSAVPWLPIGIHVAVGTLQGHWPEVNPLIPHGRVDPFAGVPDYNADVTIER